MKKLLLLGISALLTTSIANADTVSGEVVSTKKDAITVRTDGGDKMTFHTTDGTTYRQKRISYKGKMRKGKRMSAATYYEPMVEEDDWVEITYTPATNDMQSAEIQEVIVYDD